MNPQAQQNDNPAKLSKSSIENLLSRSISDEYYELLLKESLIHLLETKENEEYE
ncbi:hypothetical protein [Paenibacillus tianjinensis]|uniref:Uncharacterized protein n=1 Tax=Paenibacillus tianjinensis TaxID=2810347 RepID=A0ABX7L5I0_9BACL|nr:hypothetical protein [Paenibacillus tianjinensis]QSF43350.1 hypothetical protein JRJ22_18975 [Paenibacillus tianjinensis]